MKKVSLYAILTLALLLFFVDDTAAQCAMCKANAEQSDIAAGLNTGILYLLAMPYLLFLGIWGVWYYNYRKNNKATTTA